MREQKHKDMEYSCPKCKYEWKSVYRLSSSFVDKSENKPLLSFSLERVTCPVCGLLFPIKSEVK